MGLTNMSSVSVPPAAPAAMALTGRGILHEINCQLGNLYKINSFYLMGLISTCNHCFVSEMC